MAEGGLLIKGFTLTELIVVIVIIGILVILALTQYGSYKETALDKEARANLKLIVAAEKIYRMRIGTYYSSGSTQPAAITNINNNLKLFLSTASNRRWDYLTTATAATDTCAQATRTSANPRNWRMRYNATDPDNDPVAGGSCP